MTVKPPPIPPEPPFSVREPFLIGIDGVTRLTLVRHAQQDYPVTDDFDHAQWEDPPLSALGHVQAHAVSAVLGEQEVDVVACSTMTRARQTAEMVASPHGIKPLVIPDLREIDSYRDLPAGVLPVDSVPADEWQERQDRFRIERRWDLMPFGEPAAEFRARCLAALTGLIAEHAGKNLVVVGHGGVINAYVADVLGLDEDLFFLPNHASLTSVVIKGQVRRIHAINEHQHLHTGILTN